MDDAAPARARRGRGDGSRPPPVLATQVGPARASPLATATIARIVEMGRDNPLWGAERLRGELPKLDSRASKRTIQGIV